MASVHYTYEQAKKTLAQSGGDRRASRLQRGSIASPSRQNKVITAGGRRDRAVSQILRGLLRHLSGAALFEVDTIQRFVTFLGVKELAGDGALCNGAGTLAKLGLVEADQTPLAKVL
jgi:hypothetical protein